MKKLPKTILQQFDDLKSVQPSAEWKQESKQQLLQELGVLGGLGKKHSFLQSINLYFRESVRQLSLKPLGALILLAGVVIGPGIATVSAARSSLPGDTLYPLKRSLENVELSLAFTEKRRAEIEITQVANRLAELNRITQEQVPSPERKQKLVLAVEEVKKGTDTVKKRLEAKKQESTPENNQEVVEIAKIIEEKTASYKEDLKISVEQLSDEVAEDADDIQLALSAVQEVAIDALNIIAVDHEEGGETVTKEELKEGVEEQLTTIKEQIDTLKDKVEDLQEEPVETDSEETEASPEEAESSEEEAPAAEEATDTESSELESTLDQDIEEQVEFIEELIELEEFRTALDKLSETKEQVDQISQDVRAEELVQDEQPTNEGQTEENPEEPVVTETDEEPLSEPDVSEEQDSQENAETSG